MCKVDLTGRCFGKLIVIKEAPKNKHGHSMWECLCNCSNTCIVSYGNLTTKSKTPTRSCGCLQKELVSKRRKRDYTGQTFGKLTAIECVGKKGYHYLWQCKCSCGSIVVVNTSHLKRGGSCGCTNKERMAKLGVLSRLPYGESAFNATYGSYKRSAKERDLVFEITKEEFRERTQQVCFYCGDPSSNRCLRTAGAFGAHIYNGLDRVDPTKGYRIDNLVPCCKVCNRAKRDMAIEDFIYWIERMSGKHAITLINKLCAKGMLDESFKNKLIA
jgi:hypothetical protein